MESIDDPMPKRRTPQELWRDFWAERRAHHSVELLAGGFAILAAAKKERQQESATHPKISSFIITHS